MPKVEAWECGKSGSLFKTEHAWRRHLADKAYHKKLHEKRLKRLAESECIPEMKACRSFEELACWIENNADRLYIRAAMRDHLSLWPVPKKQWKWVPPKDFSLRKVSFDRIIWEDSCSNSHCAPAGKKTNWGRDKNKPSGYPGFRGSIIFNIGKHYTHSTNIFKETGIHTGSGGGGDHSQYEVTLFAEEWPLLVLHDQKLYQARANNRFPPGVTGPSRIYEGGKVA